jgi:AraC family transcriptional regulator, regulatory protein of adaptative response / methylated-DNA-[protein]-cysteine methyltransferase
MVTFMGQINRASNSTARIGARRHRRCQTLAPSWQKVQTMKRPETQNQLGSPAPGDPGNITEMRWEAVGTRDKAFDGEFVYAVRTTGVYCRPSCPSRPAKRQNVEFFELTHDARAAGYRACKRCKPDDMALALRRNDVVTATCRRIESSSSALPLNELAQGAGLSPHHFHRVFKQITGLTPLAYFQSVRKRRVEQALASSTTVTEALYQAGFNSSGRFYEDGASELGMAPSAARNGGAGARIRYAVEPCALGMILVAATPQGVCGIEFGDSAHTLLERLRQRFAQARFEPGDALFREWMGRVLAYIDHPSGVLDLPLDIQGTVFQRRVWQALRAIPSGSTASYAQVAVSIGQPKAFRAVAQACANNEMAVAIPCHRVVRSDGNLSGYRWGPLRKAELLRREAEE